MWRFAWFVSLPVESSLGTTAVRSRRLESSFPLCYEVFPRLFSRLNVWTIHLSSGLWLNRLPFPVVLNKLVPSYNESKEKLRKVFTQSKKVIACTEIFLYDDDCSNSSESMPNTRYKNSCIITITQLMNENCCPIQDSKAWWYTNWIDCLIPFFFLFYLLEFRLTTHTSKTYNHLGLSHFLYSGIFLLSFLPW